MILLSEYAISRVDRPVYLNRILRAEGLVQVRTENGGETLDCGECRAFALCDHQVVHKCTYSTEMMGPNDEYEVSLHCGARQTLDVLVYPATLLFFRSSFDHVFH